MTTEVLTRQGGQNILSSDEMNIQPELGGISVQNGDGKLPRIRIDDDGFKLLSASGAVLASIDENGFKYLDGAGNVICEIGTTGFSYYKNGVKTSTVSGNGYTYYNSSGKKIAEVNESGFNFYDGAVLRASITQDSNTGYVRMLTYDASGRKSTIMGQNPADGTPVIAAVQSGYDIETELSR